MGWDISNVKQMLNRYTHFYEDKILQNTTLDRVVFFIGHTHNFGLMTLINVINWYLCLLAFVCLVLGFFAQTVLLHSMN